MFTFNWLLNDELKTLINWWKLLIALIQVTGISFTFALISHCRLLQADPGLWHSGGCYFSHETSIFSDKVNLFMATVHPDGADPSGRTIHPVTLQTLLQNRQQRGVIESWRGKTGPLKVPSQLNMDLRQTHTHPHTHDGLQILYIFHSSGKATQIIDRSWIVFRGCQDFSITTRKVPLF